MISSLRGKLIFSDYSFAVIECGGVGFKCAVTKNTYQSLPQVGSEVFLNTYLSVREDALDLYGFSTTEELEAFKLILSVNGVGAKIGIAILSDFSADALFTAIASGDYKMLTRAAGVGVKLAQRIVLELKDKIGSVATDNLDVITSIGNANASSNTAEAITALVSLGYSRSEASMAVGRLDATLSTEELIKGSLKILARGL